MSNRFEFIKDCHGNTVLIDKTHQLPALPFLVMFDDLTDEDKRMLNKWLKYLNGGVDD